VRGGKVSNNLYELLLFSQVTCYAKPIPSSLMFFLCFSDPSFSFSATFTVNKYTLNLTWRDLGRPPWLALVVARHLIDVGENGGRLTCWGRLEGSRDAHGEDAGALALLHPADRGPPSSSSAAAAATMARSLDASPAARMCQFDIHCTTSQVSSPDSKPLGNLEPGGIA